MGLPNIGPVELIMVFLLPAIVVLLIFRWLRRPAASPTVYLAPNPYTGPACRACGHASVPGADHCTACGARLVPPGSQAVEEQRP